jgi:hypothetical protein
LAIDRSSGVILVLDALDYQSPGKALLYSESGSIIDSSQVGLIPAMAIQTIDWFFWITALVKLIFYESGIQYFG